MDFQTLTLLTFLLSAQADTPAEPGGVRSFSVTFTHTLVSELPTGVRIEALDADGALLEGFTGAVTVEGVLTRDGGKITDAGPFRGGVFELKLDPEDPQSGVLVPSGEVRVRLRDGPEGVARGRAVSPWLTIVPPFVAIFLALLTRQVLISLFCGVWAGVLILHSGNPLSSFLASVDTYVVGALADEGHASILLFSLCLGGMVGIIQATGGIHGIVALISRFARGVRSGQLSTWLLGTVIFFDDYANSLIVGNTMRPFTDKVRISREKLSFIVDSTAAPVATVGIISTWTAYQLGLIGDVLPTIPALDGAEELHHEEPYLYFLNSIPYSFYSLLMLLLVFLVGATLRDFGPMRRAEERCRRTGKVLRDGADPLVDDSLSRLGGGGNPEPRWYNAAVPIGSLILLTVIGLHYTGLETLEATALAEAERSVPVADESGRQAAIEAFVADRLAAVGLKDIIGKSDAYKALLWASVVASIIAAGLGLAQGKRPAKLLGSWVEGARSLVLAAMILILAWSISGVCQDLRTGDSVAWMAPAALKPQLIPAVAFVTAGIIAFSTGTSYGTMGILIPILLPLCYKLASANGLEQAFADHLGFATLAAVLGGAVFGDHCSPISDTTVLSSMASGADHIDHVTTQMPYAMLVAAICVPLYLLVGLGLKLAIALPIAAVALVGVFFLISRVGSTAPVALEDLEETREEQLPEGPLA